MSQQLPSLWINSWNCGDRRGQNWSFGLYRCHPSMSTTSAFQSNYPCWTPVEKFLFTPLPFSHATPGTSNIRLSLSKYFNQYDMAMKMGDCTGTARPVVVREEDYICIEPSSVLRSIWVSDFLATTTSQDLIDHFQSKRNGGDEIESIIVSTQGDAVITFRSPEGKMFMDPFNISNCFDRYKGHVHNAYYCVVADKQTNKWYTCTLVTFGLSRFVQSLLLYDCFSWRIRFTSKQTICLYKHFGNLVAKEITSELRFASSSQLNCRWH